MLNLGPRAISTNTLVCTYIYALIYIYMYIYVNIYIHTHIYIYAYETPCTCSTRNNVQFRKTHPLLCDISQILFHLFSNLVRCDISQILLDSFPNFVNIVNSADFPYTCTNWSQSILHKGWRA